MKNYADNKNSKPSNINIGDTVKSNKTKPTNKPRHCFDPKPYVVTDMKGSMITASRGNTDKTRNSSHFKKVPPYIPIADQHNKMFQFLFSRHMAKKRLPVVYIWYL